MEKLQTGLTPKFRAGKWQNTPFRPNRTGELRILHIATSQHYSEQTYHCHRASTQSTAQQNLIISQSLDFIRKVRFYFLKRCSSKRTIYIGRKSKSFLFFWPTIKILTASKRISRKLTLSNEIGKEIHRVRAKFWVEFRPRKNCVLVVFSSAKRRP